MGLSLDPKEVLLASEVRGYGELCDRVDYVFDRNDKIIHLVRNPTALQIQMFRPTLGPAWELYATTYMMGGLAESAIIEALNRDSIHVEFANCQWNAPRERFLWRFALKMFE